MITPTEAITIDGYTFVVTCVNNTYCLHAPQFSEGNLLSIRHLIKFLKSAEEAIEKSSKEHFQRVKDSA